MALILIADDSATEIFVLQQMLEANDHTVITAADGQQAVEKVQVEQPDIVLMDVVMPHLNGFQATRLLGKYPETADIPIIIVSSKDQETDRVWGLRQGAKGYLGKPVTEETLLAEIEKVLAGDSST